MSEESANISTEFDTRDRRVADVPRLERRESAKICRDSAPLHSALEQGGD